ncbi:MAG: stress response translation initiation inhibitor YciH [Candidatus Micrarchaeia archaeon]
MTDICPKCGLPKELCVCDILDRETESKIKIYTKKAKFNKVVTVIEGIAANKLEDVAKSIKHALACGGTYKQDLGIIELQGNHVDKAREALISIGYAATSIEVG